jgi:hypothetical protein
VSLANYLAAPAQPLVPAPSIVIANDNVLTKLEVRSPGAGAVRRRAMKALQMRTEVMVLRSSRDALTACGRGSRALELALWAAQYRADAWEALAEGDAEQAARLRRTVVAFARSSQALEMV